MIKIVNNSLSDSNYLIDRAIYSMSETKAIAANELDSPPLTFKGQVNTLEELKTIYNLFLQQQVGFESYIYYGKSKVFISLELLQYNVIALSNNLKSADMDDAESFFDFSVLCSQYDMYCYRETTNYCFS